MFKNGSFEGAFTERGYPEGKVAPDWELFYSQGEPPEGDYVCGRPEYKPVSRREDSYRVISGETCQCWFIRYRVMDAGIYQRITGLPANAPFSFYVPVQAWCSNRDDPRVSGGELYFRLGIELSGQTDPWASSVIWADWERGTAEYKEMSISGITLTPNVTIFIRAWNKWRLSHNDAYVDDVRLELDSPVEDQKLWQIAANNLERWAAEIRRAIG